jgi:hypothetical protein
LRNLANLRGEISEERGYRKQETGRHVRIAASCLLKIREKTIADVFVREGHREE